MLVTSLFRAAYAQGNGRVQPQAARVYGFLAVQAVAIAAVLAAAQGGAGGEQFGSEVADVLHQRNSSTGTWASRMTLVVVLHILELEEGDTTALGQQAVPQA